MRKLEEEPVAVPETDEFGFLTNADTWNESVAQLLAQLAEKEMPKGLTEDHWKIVNYMRKYYLEFGSVPPVRKVSRDTGISFREMMKLFPDGLRAGACRIAGIPNDVIKPSFLYP